MKFVFEKIAIKGYRAFKIKTRMPEIAQARTLLEKDDFYNNAAVNL